MLTALVAIAPAAAWAQMYRCTSEIGRPIYSDVPCGPKATVVEVKPSGGGSAINPMAQMKVAYYDVSGTTPVDLGKEIRSKGPDGWWGSAHTRLSFTLTPRESKDGCVAAEARAAADSVVRLPRWVNRHEAGTAVQQHFDREFRSLEYHERGHVQISLDAARELERAILAIPPQPTCQMLTAEAKKRDRELQLRHRDRQESYDLQTNHGMLQSPYR